MPRLCSSGGAMGSRGRSIRLRIYFLVAIPLVAMVGLLAYVAGTSINNAVNLDRAPDLINATSLPTADVHQYLQDERAAAVIYLFQPTPANLAAYDAAIRQPTPTEAGVPGGHDLAGLPRQRDGRRGEGDQRLISGLGQLAAAAQRGVTGRALTPLQALGGYSHGHRRTNSSCSWPKPTARPTPPRPTRRSG